ncbi:MAG: hypothetical protein ACI9JN_000128 [Bacteroidia bacterium]|jgi:hypothetical protein
MKKTIGLLTLVFGLFTTIFAQDNLFQRTIGGSKSENSYAVEKTLDGGFISVGYTESYGKGKKDIYLVKTDGLGQVEWSKAYGESGDDIGWNVTIANDSGFVVIGSTNSYNSEGDALVLKVSKSGSFEWARTIASDSLEDGYNIIRSLYSNGYYITGYVKNDSNGDQGFIAKLGTGGNIRWHRTFGSPGDEEAYGLAEDGQGNVIITGLTTYDSITNGGLSGSSGSSDAFIAKFDSIGGFKWMKTYGSAKDDAGWGVKVDRNKYIIAGWTKAVSTGDNDMFIMTCDTSGGSIDAIALGSTGTEDRAFDIVLRPNNTGFMVVGYAEPMVGNREVVFVDFNGSGVLGNTVMLGGADRDGHWPTDITSTDDGGYVILSTSKSFNSNGDDDLFITKIREDGTALCNSTVDPLNSFTLNLQSRSFGSVLTGYTSKTRSVSVSAISTVTDSTLCCKLSAALPKDKVSVCANLAVAIGTKGIRGLKYTWTNTSTGKVVSSKADPRVAPSTTTTYKLVVSSDDQACDSDSSTVTVTVNQFLTEDMAKDTSFCDGDSARIIGSSNLISYLWAGTHINSNARTNTFKKSDTVYFTGIDGNSCIYNDTMVVSVFSNPVFDLGKDTTICEILSITLSGPVNMTSYNWNNGAGSAQTFKTSTEKTHKLDVVDSNGCVFSDAITILTNPSSPFSLGADDTLCPGSSFLILGPGALSGYIWNDTASTLQNLRVFAGGQYHLAAFNSFGCPSFDTITIVERDAPTFNLGADFALCTGTSRYLVGPVDLTTYKWNNNTTNDSLRITTSGDYWLKVTDKFLCSYTDSISVSNASNPAISLGKDTTIIIGDSLVLTPGAGYAKYTWSTTETTPSIVVKTDNTYSVTVVDQNGCEGSASIVVSTKLSVASLQLLSLTYYPNPAKNIVHLDFGSMSTDELTAKVVDLTGRVLQTDTFDVYPGQNSQNINVSELPAGNYLILLGNSKGSATLKIVVE